MPRGRRRTKEYSQGVAYQDYERLKKEYDAKRGGYTVTQPRRGRRPSSEVFVESQYTPEQGGYYAEQGTRERRPGRRGGTTTVGGEYYDPKRASAITDWAKEDKRRTSAAKPFQRVDPSVVAARRSRKRQRAAAAGRGSTVLTGRERLGATDDERLRRRTLLGS